MQWNNTATEQGIFQDIDFLCNTNSATYSIAHKTRNVNYWLDIIVAEVLDSMDEWDIQGAQAYSNLVAGQLAYPWPSAILKIKRVEIDYDGDGEYVVADPIDSTTIETSIATSAEINAAFGTGNPKYDAYAMSAFLLPVPDVNRSSGLIIWHNANVTQFTATAAMNTAEPSFARPFHKILSLGASLDWARKDQTAKLITFCERELYGNVQTRKGRVGGLFTRLRAFYGTRAADKVLALRTKYFKKNYK